MLHVVSCDLTEKDINRFINLFVDNISVFYPCSTDLTAKAIVEVHKLNYDPKGYFTKRKKIWKALAVDGSVLGFTVVTEKRGGSIKFGPTIVEEKFRSQGIGSSLRLMLEDIYSNLGYRKSYSTTNTKNIPAIFYLTKIGYVIEAFLKDHYEMGSNEIVLAKKLSPNKICISVPQEEFKQFLSSNLGTDINILDKLSNYYDELDKSFLENITKCLTNQLDTSENFFINKSKVIFTVENKCLAVTSPKRVGCVKASPIIFSESEEKNRRLINDIILFYEQNYHKIYTLIPLELTKNIKLLKYLGFNIEGIINEPYKKDVDMIVMSYFIHRR